MKRIAWWLMNVELTMKPDTTIKHDLQWYRYRLGARLYSLFGGEKV